jgi:hypothetical protein
MSHPGDSIGAMDERHLRPFALSGITLRYVLTAHLRRDGEQSVAELLARLEADGAWLVGRPSKVVSDALRWEIRRGRVVRTGWGTYAPGHIPRATWHRICRHVEDWRRSAPQPPVAGSLSAAGPAQEPTAA